MALKSVAVAVALRVDMMDVVMVEVLVEPWAFSAVELLAEKLVDK